MRKGIAGPAVVVCGLAMTTVSVVPAAASAPRSGPGPSGVTIEIAAVNGSGCPPGTAGVALSEDRNTFTVTHRGYSARVGDGSKPTDFLRNCLLGVRVHVPRGFTYAISSADHRGYASLQPGAEAMLYTRYYFQGAPGTTDITHRLPGPFKRYWQFVDEVPVPELVWRPCGEERNFNIVTELQVNAGSSDPSAVSYISTSGADGNSVMTYQFAWKTCPSRHLG
ncbi:DUF4360 domain-containing protein [Actinomadura roseirufa]|uniref:DUF4360 domain-containing protein n=1 Tax=Actinomadura roseirufa TaxID=2094049 RepID=UPI001A95624E|nr:DUF4360 domain-containing protein [Actinomadura roseirufa]